MLFHCSRKPVALPVINMLFLGYKLEDIKDLCNQLNDMLHKKPKTTLATVRNKYSHK